MIQTPFPSALAVALLDRLEREEQKLLCWGYTDGAFDTRELESHARVILDGDTMSNGGSPGALITELLRRHWLFRIPNEPLYRTRSAETIRLLSKLRQIRVYPSTRRGEVDRLWRAAPPLVADYRFLAPPRTFPRRDVVATEVETTLRLQGSPLARALLGGFVGVGSREERKLSGFQVRAADRILSHPTDAGTVVCSGTGSGKTIAFYLPAFIALAPLLDSSSWTKCIAIYPRNELLKDQLREAIASARRVAPVLRAHHRRSLTFGAFFGEVKNDADHVARPKWGWAEHTFGGKRGRICPFLKCPDCGATLFWADEDRCRREPLEQLRCTATDCDTRLGSDILRLTRQSLRRDPPDILFVSTEMMNRNMSASACANLFGIDQPERRRPRLLLLDEVHTYEGAAGAHVALLLRRWRFLSHARPHVVGLSATLEDAARFFADLAGLQHGSVVEIAPLSSELEAEGADYQVAVRGDSNWSTSLLSTTIQTLMLMRRVLAPHEGPLSLAGRRVFAFTDRLDGINRLLANARDSEGRYAKSNNPRAKGTVLAGLRRVDTDEKDHDARYADGQAWDLVEKIGHRLELSPARASSLVISRTTAQDTGVDPNADIVVATASLEVGYDDPSVGAVVQHKAPRSAAAFLQRKGRAGRLRHQRPDGTSISMRPWTVVVLSDFGRDRLAYQDYEHIFSPTLKPRHLPTKNRALLRMQATYALFDYLGSIARKGGLAPDPWLDLAAPCSEGTWDSARRERQRFYQATLRRLLDDQEAQDTFAKFLQGALSVSADEVQAILWEPPRSVMLEAVPTLWRRLAYSWRRAFETSLEPVEKWGPPLPEFVQRSLFTKLLVPELTISVPSASDLGQNDEDELASEDHGMVLAEALREFTPGRVSMRFDLEGGTGHWINPSEEPIVSIGTFSGREERAPLGRFSYFEAGVEQDVDVYRPQMLRVSMPPKSILPTSNARPCWRSQLVTSAAGHPVELPDGSTLTPIVVNLTFHTHHLGSPVEIRRFVVGADVATSRTGGMRDPERRIHFVDEDGTRVGLGWAAEVDALAVRCVVPVDLPDHARGTPALLRSLRPLRFRSLMRGDPSLDGIANGFQRDGLVDAYLAVLLLLLDVAAGATLESVSQSVTPSDVARAVALVSDGEDDDDDVEGAVSRRVRELMALIADPHVFGRLRAHGAALWQDVDEGWAPWLRSIFKATLGASLRDAILALCPQVDEDDLVIEGEGMHRDDECMVWVTESAVGGSGGLEAFYAAYAKDPRHFARLWHGCLEPSDSERVATSLEDIVEALAGENRSERLIAAVARVREPSPHADKVEAVRHLKETLVSLGLYVEHATLTTIFARVIRPGTGPELDAYLAETLRHWRELEERAGIVVDIRHFALVRSRRSGLESLLATAPNPASELQLQGWRYATLLGLLWRRSAGARREALGSGNPFVEAAARDRLIVPLPGEASPIIRIATESWFEELTDALNRNGVARLLAGPQEKARLADAVRHLAVHPIDTGGLLVFVRLGGYARCAEGTMLTVEMPEALQ